MNLNYSDVKPIGFPSHVRQEKYTPIAFNTSTSGVSSSDIIRFNISTNGFWDPYSAYIKLEVDVSGMDGLVNSSGGSVGNGCGSLQVDNSASSFIGQLIIYKGGTEIERIEEYDTLAAILNDMNSSNDNRLSRYFEGLYAQTTQAAQQYCNPINYMNTLTYGFSPNQYVYPGVTPSVSSFSINLAPSTTFITRYEYFLTGLDGKNSIQATNTVNTNCSISANGTFTNTNVSQLYSGYQTPYNQSLSSYGNECILSKNFNQSSIYQGIPQSPIVVRQTFCIPLISGLLGILMPQESYKYIPMKALQELILEFRLNPYAMFTSGYADGATNLSPLYAGGGGTALATTTYPMLSRIWKINKFEINVEVQYFESQIENIILSQLNTEKGIVIHSNSWLLGPKYQISAGTTPNGTYQINLGFESLKNCIWVFIPDEFQTYTFCRKQFRLSANITQMYIKIGSEYYPPLPVTGNAGNAGGYTSIDSDQGNAEFIVQLYKAFGKFHDIQNNCIVNPVNFALNARMYNPANTTALMSSGNLQINWDTAVGQSQFHENRAVGRAIYAMNLETLNQDWSVISGVNTINNRPFEVTLKSSNVNGYGRSYTMYVFCQYDMLIQLRSSGVNILGRG